MIKQEIIENIHGLMELFMRALGCLINQMEWENILVQMAEFIKVSLLMVIWREKENLYGRMEEFMKVTGYKVNAQAKVK